ncbi:MAG: formate dehydrogenase, partial [Hyphomicrobium sp.]
MIRVFVPRDAAALSVGADEVAAAIANEARSRKLDIQIVRNGSRGMLYLEPLVEVELPGGRVAYGPVKPSDVKGLFDAGFLEGKGHPLGHGRTEEIPYLKNQERLTFARCGITDPLSIEDYRAHGGFVGLARALNMKPIDIVTEVTTSGLRCRGGAGFTTGIKWKTVHDLPPGEKYVCCNADEGDSGTFADRMLMEGDPFCLIEGMTIAAIAGGAQKGYIYVRSEYPHSVRVLREAIEIAKKANWLGDNIQGTKFSFDLFVRMGAGAYIC